MAPALLLLLALHAQDPVRVGARLTDEEIQAGETTILRVDVETDGARAQFRPFETLPPGIQITGTRDYDQRQFSLPGGTRRFITREFVLQARAPGRYRIPALEVVVEGGVYSTSSLLLAVTAAPARERGETRGGEDGVMLRAWLDADTVVVGEQVTLEVEAMFSQTARIQLRRAPEYEPPSPSGFWVHDLPDPGRQGLRSVGSEDYEVQRFRRAFFPLAAGDYTIPPARIEYEMRRGLLYAPETRELESDPLPLTVLPIPADPPPAFTGAVGDYTVRARLEPRAVPVGEAAVLTVEVEGTGNVKALPPPELPAIRGVDAFPPSQEAETDVEGTRIRGRKTFSWVLIPREAGDVEIPAIRYAFFDPARGGFETATVAPFTLRVSPGAASDSRQAPATIRFLKMAPDPEPWPWVRSSWFAALQTLPLLLLAMALGWRYRRTRRGRVSVGALRRERKRVVRELERRAEKADDGEVFADAEAFARRWLARRLGLTAGALGAATLAAVDLPPLTVNAVRGALDRVAAARYAPAPPRPAERQDIIAALGRVLEAVDRAAPRGLVGRDRTGAVAFVLTALLVTGLAGPAAGQEPDGPTDTTSERAGATDPAPGPEAEAAVDLFNRGLAAFEGGAYESAAETFRRYVSRAPRDAAGWYNLGTAYHREGRTGYDVWAWLTALRLDPRDNDTRHNLRVSGAPPELVQRVAPPLPLRVSELLLLAAVVWLLTGIAAAVWVVRRGRASGATALAGLAVALLLAGASWYSTHGPETLVVLDASTLRAGPALQTEPVATLRPGTGLVPVDRYGEWVRARTLRGEEGWIERARTESLR